MAKQCIVNVTVVTVGTKKNVSWTNVNSLGQREDKSETFTSMTAQQIWTAVAADCNAFEARTVNPPAPPAKEMPGIYDPTVPLFSGAIMNPADYPPGVSG
jgi:hypothetical protein